MFRKRKSKNETKNGTLEISIIKKNNDKLQQLKLEI